MVCRDSYKQFLLHFQVYDTSIVPLSTAKHCFLLMLKTTCPDVGKGPFCFWTFVFEQSWILLSAFFCSPIDKFYPQNCFTLYLIDMVKLSCYAAAPMGYVLLLKLSLQGRWLQQGGWVGCLDWPLKNRASSCLNCFAGDLLGVGCWVGLFFCFLFCFLALCSELLAFQRCGSHASHGAAGKHN